MKTAYYTLILMLFTITQTSAQNGSKNFIDQPYIEVSGHAQKEVTPDEIYVRIILNENDKKGRISIEKQENQLLAKLRKINIDIDKQLTVEDFDGYYKRKFLANNELTKIKRYQLLVYDGETLGKVYQELDAIDISNISIIRVDHSEMESLKRATKLKALKLAKQKAQDYALAIDQEIGNALHIKENSNNYTINSMGYANASARKYESMDMEAINDIDFKKIIISETVHAKFILD